MPSHTALLPPPRRLQWPVFCAVAMDWAGAFWALFLSVWVVHLTFFAADGSPGEVLRLRLYGQQAAAVVTAVKVSDTKLDGEPLAHIAYVYNDARAGQRQALAYDRASAWLVGDIGTAVYVPGEAVSRLRGPGQEPYGLFGWIQWILPLSALILGSTAWRRGIEAVLLLKFGVPTDAEVTMTWRMRFKARFRVQFKFQDDKGRTRVNWSDLPADVLPANGKARALYVPGQPFVACLIDAIPWKYPLTLDDGDWLYRGGTLPVFRFMVAGSSLAMAVLCGALHLIGYLPDIGR